MRENVRSFVAAAAAAFAPQGPVYEFGAFQVEGQQPLSDLRPLFPSRRYVGCDARPGPGVDRVEDLAKLSLPDGLAATVICVDTLEHVFEVRRAIDEMLRVLAPGGMLLVSVPMDFKIHAYPDDYWRLTPRCLDRLLSPLAARIIGSQGVEHYPHSVFAVGCKSPVPATFARDSARFLEDFQNRLAAQAQSAPWQDKLKRHLLSWLRSRGERRRLREYYRTRFVLDMRTDPAWEALSVHEPSGDSHLGSRLDLI